MDLITITPHTDHEGKECLKMELTIDGATALGKHPETQLSFLYDSISNPTDSEKLRVSTFGGQIYTSTIIDWQKDPAQTIKVWTGKFPNENPAFIWQEHPKAFFLYYPDTAGNKKRESDITAMIAATNWALHEQQQIDKVAVDINERHNQLMMIKGHIQSSLRMLQSPIYKQDPKYTEQLKMVCSEMQKEIDYCFHKADLLFRITKSDLRSKDPVSKKYREFRNIDEVKNQDKTTIEIHEKQEEETAPDTSGQDGGSIGKSN